MRRFFFLSLLVLSVAVLPAASGEDENALPAALVTDSITGRTFEALAVLQDGATDHRASVVGPKAVEAGGVADFVFRFRAGSNGIPAGGTILMILPSTKWTEPQIDVADGPGFIEAQTTSGESPAIVVNPRGSEMTPSRTRVEVFFHLAEKLAARGTMTIRVHGVRVQGVAIETPVRFYVDTDGDARFDPVVSQPAIAVKPSAARHVRLFCPSELVAERAAACRAVAIDRFGNGAPLNAKLRLMADGVPFDLPGGVDMKNGAAAFSITGKAAGIGRVRAEVAGKAASVTVSSCPVRVFEDDGRHRLVWGDPQIHSGYSDAFVPIEPAQVFAYTRRVAGLDFAAVTDHAEGIWGNPLTKSEWDRTRQQAEAANEPGAFAAILGQEWTATFDWDGQFPRGAGHRHMLFPGYGDYGLFRADDPRYPTPEKLAAALRGTGAVTIPHHMLVSWGETDWDHFVPGTDVAAEIVSTHGVSECVGCGPPMTDGMKGDQHSFQEAIARGYRIATVGGSDNHGGHPGLDDFPGGEPLQLDTGALTCARVRELTPAGVIEAIRERRVYATSGARIYLDFAADGRRMGSEYDSTKPPTFEAVVIGTDKIARIDVVKHTAGGPRPFEPVKTIRPGTWHWQGQVTDGAFGASSVYYLRILQDDGERAWSSPIWVDRP